MNSNQMMNSNKESVKQFFDLSLVSLSEIERDELHRSLKTYQRTHNLAEFAKSCSPLLRTTDRARLLHFIRAPMSMPERLQFDRLLGIHEKSNRSGLSSPSHLDVQSLAHSTSTNRHSGPERYVTIQGSRGNSMGFSIRGGSEFGLGIYVSAVSKKSPCGVAGLRLGDQILSANGVDFTSVANSSAIKVLSSSAVLHLRIQRCGKVPEWKVARQRVLWYDVALCKVVRIPPVTENQDSRSSVHGRIVEQKVIINVNDNSEYIGLNIRGGLEYGVGIYVSRVDPGGLAHKAGISAGDQIVKVNDISFEKIEHSDAVDVLRSNANLITTIRSVGKYPIFKELCAEYSWSTVGNVHFNKNTSNEVNKRKIQRTRARESSIDLTPYTPEGNINQAYDNSDIEEIDDGLEVQTQLCHPKDEDIMFRRSYEDSWQQIDSINDDHMKAEEGSKSWAADYTDSLGHYNQDSDMSDSNMDYTAFLEQNKTVNGQNSNGKYKLHADSENLVIETVIEEETTSFSSKKQSSPPSKHGNYVVNASVNNSSSSNNYGHVSSPKGSVKSNHSSSDSSYHSGKLNTHKNSSSGRKSSKMMRAPVIPSNASSTSSDMANGDEDVDNIASQIKQLEARKSHLGTWEITRVAGSSSSSLPSSPEIASGSDRSRSSWSTLKKRIKGSLRRQGPKFTGRYLPNSNSPHQKGVFERSFGSQILNTQASDRYNLMAVLEDHARKILTEDECKAVLRHINNYQENKDLERLVQLLLAILDKEDKQVLLIDVRGVIHPAHLEKYDKIMDHCHIRGYNTSTWTRTPNPSSIGPVIVQSKKQPAPQVPSKDITKGSANGENVQMSQFATFSKEDFNDEPEQLEIIILEKDERENVIIPRNNEDDNEDYEDFDGVETVYVSKHKNFLGLELCGGRDNPNDTVIRVKEVVPGGAASDDRRIQPGIEITEIDGKSTKGLGKREAQAILIASFSQKSPVNLGIEIRHSYHL